MNIFVTETDPILSAKVLDDKRLIKMVLESTQLLMTAINYTGGIKTPYKPTHIQHPCSIWTRQSRSNYLWVLEHCKALSSEYTNRFNKQHKCAQYIDMLDNYSIVIPNGELTPFTNCSFFKDELDIFTAYKNTLNMKWNSDKNPKWTNTNPPNWKL